MTNIDYESHEVGDQMDSCSGGDETSDGYIESGSEEEGDIDHQLEDLGKYIIDNGSNGEEMLSNNEEAVSNEDSDEPSGIEVLPPNLEDVTELSLDIIEKDAGGEKSITKKKRKRKPKDNSKLPPQRQKRLIHRLLKKAKIYEIRKLTRRINTLKASKGTEEQQAKKIRKADRLYKEIEAMREFMIDQLTDRTVDVFKGRSDKLYNEMWESCSDPVKANDMLQLLCNKEADNFTEIAYFRMLSSKDIVGKFQRISVGENLSVDSCKDETNSVKENRKRKTEDKGGEIGKNNSKKPKMVSKKTIKEGQVNETQDVEATSVRKSHDKSKKSEEKLIHSKSKDVDKAKNGNSTISIDQVSKAKSKVKEKKSDDFFMGDAVQLSESDSDKVSEIESEEEFSAPIKRDAQPPNIMKKKNRMGQRDRKRLQGIKHKRVDPKQQRFRGRGRGGGRGSTGRDSSTGRGSKAGRSSDSYNSRRRFENHEQFNKSSISSPRTTVTKTIDESLHPSWQAKQKQKSQQGIADFAGTKITFDD